jgi:hypothetical protein
LVTLLTLQSEDFVFFAFWLSYVRRQRFGSVAARAVRSPAAASDGRRP